MKKENLMSNQEVDKKLEEPLSIGSFKYGLEWAFRDSGHPIEIVNIKVGEYPTSNKYLIWVYTFKFKDKKESLSHIIIFKKGEKFWKFLAYMQEWLKHFDFNKEYDSDYAYDKCGGLNNE